MTAGNLHSFNDALRALSPVIANHLWQSTAFAAAAGLLAFALRNNQARTRHWIWMAASLKFLLPFALLAGIAGHFAGPRVVASANPAVYSAVEDFSEPFAVPDGVPVVPEVAARPRLSLSDWLPLAITAVWLAGFVVALIVWTVRWRRIARAMHSAEPLCEGREFEMLRQLEQAGGVRRPMQLVLSESAMEPGVFGLGIGTARPVLAWPAGISERLDDAHLETVLAHEVCHVRRWDNLTAALHMFVEAAFWFHPLVWWMGAQLVAERERACDEEVLQLLNRPQVYAESILKVCEFCVESPLECVAGVTGADLKKRIVEIMRARAVLRLTWGKKLLIGAAMVCAIAVPVVLGQAKAAHRLMLAAIKVAPKPLQTAAHAMIAEEEALSTGEIAQVALPQDLPGLGQLRFDLVSGPRFEAAHVDRNKRVPISLQSVTTREGDRYVVYSLSMQALISEAYGVTENQVIGGPPWLESDRYDIEAKTPATTSVADIKLMLRALLEERFHLTVQNGTFPQAARILSLEKGGLKLKPSDGKGEAGCKPSALAPSTPSVPPTLIFDCRNQTSDDIAHLLEDHVGWRDKRPVIDRTGLKGNFDFKLSWTPPMVGPDVVPFTEAFSSQLGLKIESGTAPWAGLLVEKIDEEPAPDPPDTATIMPPRPQPQFDVAVIKPFDPNNRTGNRNPPPDEFLWNPTTLRELITDAWDMTNMIPVVNAPEWLDKDFWYIDAKVLRDQPASNANNPPEVDPQRYELMVRSLLEQRFRLQAHMEEREGDAYDLVAVNPKLTPVDPDLPVYDHGRRNGCTGAPGPNMVDPRIKNPALNKVTFCTNMTMKELADQMQGMGAPVRDRTGLTGRYNYVLAFTKKAGLMQAGGNGSPSGDANGSASDPNGMPISLPDALQSELGLKVVKVRAQVPVLVIDHIERQPTPN